MGTIFSADQENPHDILAINAASAALMISGIPFDGPIGAVRMAYTTEGVWAPHPTFQEGDAATFELIVAGRALSDSVESEIAIMMVEAGGTEGSFVKYDEMCIRDSFTANALLGRAFTLRGTVVHGDARGQKLGFRTANMATEPRQQLPALGIYAGAARTPDRSWWPAAISVGTRPQFYDDGVVLVEVHIPGFHLSLIHICSCSSRARSSPRSRASPTT